MNLAKSVAIHIHLFNRNKGISMELAHLQENEVSQLKSGDKFIP